MTRVLLCCNCLLFSGRSLPIDHSVLLMLITMHSLMEKLIIQSLQCECVHVRERVCVHACACTCVCAGNNFICSVLSVGSEKYSTKASGVKL